MIELYGEDHFLDCKSPLRFNIRSGYLYSKESEGVKGASTCTSVSREVFASHQCYQQFKEVLFTDAIKEKLSSKEIPIKEQIEYAKSFIGKRIKRHDGFVVEVSGIEFDTECEGAYTNSPRHKIVTDLLDSQGVTVKVVFLNPPFPASWGSITHPTLLPLELYNPVVKVNGFPAEEFQDHYKFGCAKISKNLLANAKALIEQSLDTAYHTKPIESIKIGAGVFTLEILNQLNL